LKVRSPPPLLFFEQQTRDAEQAAIAARCAAKEAAAKARAEAKEKEDREKLTCRLLREDAYRRKHPSGFAQCGINW
jgi:phosphopantetheinyl transferase (holo-ACP synthase)